MSLASFCRRLTQEKHDKMCYKISNTKKYLFPVGSFLHHGLIFASCSQKDAYLNLVKMTCSSLKSFYYIDFLVAK